MGIVYILGGLVLGVFWIAVTLFVVATPFLAWIAWARSRSLSQRVLQLERELTRLRGKPEDPQPLPVLTDEILPDKPTPMPKPVSVSSSPGSVPAAARTTTGRLEGILGRHV